MKRLKAEKTTHSDFFPKYLKLVNVILPKPLTLKEIEVLSEFMKLKGDIVSEDRFGTQARKLVREKFGFKSSSNLDNYIKYLKNKGVLVYAEEDSKKLIINKRIAIPQDEDTIELTFKFHIDDDGQE